jgi:phosphoglycolate phosphatase-like HAD superfamily hydrolase
MSSSPAFCFDFDGTLVDSNTVKRNFFLEYFSNYSGGLEFIVRVLGGPEVMDRYQIFELFVDEFGYSKNDFDVICAEFNAGLGQRVAGAPLMVGVNACLNYLHQNGHRIFINSATPETELVEIVRSRPEFDNIELVLGRPKSKAENIRKIMDICQLRADQITVVGDGEDDRVGASEMGCMFVPVFEYRGQPLAGVKPIQDLSLLV